MGAQSNKESERNMSAQIFDSRDFKWRRVRATAEYSLTLANHLNGGLGTLLVKLREKLARQCTEAILENPDHFKTLDMKTHGGVQIDVYVLTERELQDLLREQFEKGVEHARYPRMY